MRQRYTVLLVALVMGALLWPVQRASGQLDTMVVEWAAPDGTPQVNALREAIMTDTLEDGSHVQNRVYKLRSGGYYWLNDRITVEGYHLRIVGEQPGDDIASAPAVLQLVEDDEGNVDTRMIVANDDMTLKNLWINGQTNTGAQNIYQPIYVNASDSRFVFENLVLTRSNFAIIAFDNGPNNIYYRNCVFRNLVGSPADQVWQGRGISIWDDQDTVVVENNTFFNVNMTALQIEGGAAKYLRFNHNTLVHMGRAFFTGSWWREAYVTNNLVINGFWHGEGAANYTDPNRDEWPPGSGTPVYTAGMFGIDDLPAQYGPEQGRRIAFANNASWRDPYFDNNYYADSIRAQWFFNEMTAEGFFDQYDQMVAQDTMWLDSQPDLAAYPTDLDGNTNALLDSMIACVNEIRTGVTPATEYFWNLPENQDGSVCNVCITWPLPEDFSYSDENLMTAGTDGLPLGDLNWFPQEKEEFLTNKEQYVEQVEQIPGSRVEFEVATTAEAETGTVEGGEIESVDEDEFPRFRMESGGFIEWTFDLAEGGVYDLVVYTNMEGNSERGQNILVNGTNIRNDEGYGEYFFSGLPADAWVEVTITQGDLIEGADALNLTAGENTIRIEKSWGYQSFSWVQVVDPNSGDVVEELTAPEATYGSLITMSDADWTPSGFKWVDLAAGDAVSWDFDLPSDGIYRVQAYFEPPSANQTGEIQMDGETVVSTVEFRGGASDVLTQSFDATAGTHTIKLIANGDLNLDYAQLVREVATPIAPETELPEGYALKQNYPNPFNPTTRINYRLPKASDVHLGVYNLLGQKVATLVNTRMEAGSHTIHFDANEFQLASGIYFYRIQAGDFTNRKRMILLK